ALGGYVFSRAHRVTWWDVAAVHAAARGNVVYVREAHDWTMYRRHDGEPGVQRLARLLAGDCDGRVAAIPSADAPTWFALIADDVALPKDSVGFYCDREAARFATELVTELPAAK
ncbi:MAG: hypothetical protein NT062_28960, partial [Proteobacteria bacterium]|nr:hypothetical protein [Pseudomonadota bacterium]